MWLATDWGRNGDLAVLVQMACQVCWCCWLTWECVHLDWPEQHPTACKVLRQLQVPTPENQKGILLQTRCRVLPLNYTIIFLYIKILCRLSSTFSVIHTPTCHIFTNHLNIRLSTSSIRSSEPHPYPFKRVLHPGWHSPFLLHLYLNYTYSVDPVVNLPVPSIR